MTDKETAQALVPTSAYHDIYHVSRDGQVSWGSTKWTKDMIKNNDPTFWPPKPPKPPKTYKSDESSNEEIQKREYKDAAEPVPSNACLTLLSLDTFFGVKGIPTKEKNEAAKFNSSRSSSSNSFTQVTGSAQITESAQVSRSVQASGSTPSPDTSNAIRSSDFDVRQITRKDYKEIPESYKDLLDKFCLHCTMKGTILWRNIRVAESRYETRFRICKTPAGTCYLHFHTMQVPYLVDRNVILALVHHVHVPEQGSGKIPKIKPGDERIFSFVLGLQQGDLEFDQLWNILDQYQESNDTGDNVGITPKLFIAAVLKLYGFSEAKDAIKEGVETLLHADDDLLDAEMEFEDRKPEDMIDKQKAPDDTLLTAKKKPGDKKPKNTGEKQKLLNRIKTCNDLNRELMAVNKRLTGVRSRVHYIGLSARGLMHEDSSMKSYLNDEWSGGASQQHSIQRPLSCPLPSTSQNHSQCFKGALGMAVHSPVQDSLSLETALNLLDSVKFSRRDNDKLGMIARAMTQYEVDIKSLKSHAMISVGLVSNLYAQSQGNFQSVVLDSTQRDSRNMEVIAKLTIYLLPPTFWAIISAMPILDWDHPRHILAVHFTGATINGAPLVGYVLLVIVSAFVLGLYLSVKSEKRDDEEVGYAKKSLKTLRTMGTKGLHWMTPSSRRRTSKMEAGTLGLDQHGETLKENSVSSGSSHRT